MGDGGSAYCGFFAKCAMTGDWVRPSDGDFSAICVDVPRCHCDNPGGTAPNNHYTCSDSSLNAYCSDDQACVASDDVPYPQDGDFSKICQQADRLVSSNFSANGSRYWPNSFVHDRSAAAII